MKAEEAEVKEVAEGEGGLVEEAMEAAVQEVTEGGEGVGEGWEEEAEAED